MTWIISNLWLIPALPLLAAGMTAVAKRPQRRLAATLAIGSMLLDFGLSLCAFVATLGREGSGEVFRRTHHFKWLQFGDAWLELGWVPGPLAAVKVGMGGLVGLLSFICSV